MTDDRGFSGGKKALDGLEITCILVGMLKARRKNPDQTRQNLVQAAYWEIYRHGFRSASLDRILAQAGVTR